MTHLRRTCQECGTIDGMKDIERRLADAARAHGDALYARMQLPGFREAIEKAFAATPQELALALARYMERE